MVEPGETIPLVELSSLGMQLPSPDVTQEVSVLHGRPLGEALRAIIEQTLPTGAGQRHRRVFDFARLLKGHPELADCNPVSLAPYVEQWYERAFPHIRTKVFGETFSDFVRAWEHVKWPAGGGNLQAALTRAREMPVPDCAVRYRTPAKRLLVALCRELQRERGDRPFFLSCRIAAEAVGLDGREPQIAAWRWLGALCQAGILTKTQAGTLKGRKATEYRYLPPI